MIARSTLIAAVMLAVAILTQLVAHSVYVEKRQQAPTPIQLESAIPRTFAGWRVETSPLVAQVGPADSAAVDRIYGEVLARSYVNADEQRVMLSIAYGADQLNYRSHAHPQEDCYRAQGFVVSEISEGELVHDRGALPLRHLLARQPGREERVSYWTTVGDQARLPGWNRKWTQLRYGFTGRIPDGFLVRVSSLRADGGAIDLHRRFLRDLLQSIDGHTRARLGA